MLNREQAFFLSVLADHLNGRPTEPVSELNWKSIYDMTVSHRVSAIFYAQCGAFLPPEAELRFMREFGTAVANYAAQQKIVSDLDREFTRQDIPFAIVKGLAVAKNYPQPELRTMGDTDVIVKAEDKTKAHTVLLELGFHNVLQQQYHEWIYRKDSCEIELHHQLLYEDDSNTPAAVHLANRLWEFVRPVHGSSRVELSPEFHFLFLVMHLKKHIVFCGAGFRQFMDLAVMTQKLQLDWSLLDPWLEQAELQKSTGVCLVLCRKWFQLPVPFADTALDPESELRITQRIFRNGVYGYDNKDNTVNRQITQLDANSCDSLQKRLRMCRTYLSPTSPELRKLSFFHFGRILFPDYAYMRKQKNCRFLDGRPWLLPAGWFWRLICGGKYKTQCIFQIMTFRRKKVLERREDLKKMGL